jgi:hypothetical protein
VVVMTVTPVAKWEIASRKASPSTDAVGSAEVCRSVFSGVLS